MIAVIMVSGIHTYSVGKTVQLMKADMELVVIQLQIEMIGMYISHFQQMVRSSKTMEIRFIKVIQPQ